MGSANIRYNTFPSLDVLRIGLHGLTPPFSVEIRQPSDDGGYADYTEYVDVDSVEELHEFLSEELIYKNLPFTIDVEEVQPPEESDPAHHLDNPDGPVLRPSEPEWASEARPIL